MYVPFRNQPLIRTCFPTSHGYETSGVRKDIEPSRYFTDLFLDVATTDNSAYLCIPEALRFRNEVCGGEAKIREYCFRLAKEGGDRVASLLGTEVLANDSGSIQQCCFTNVRMPLTFGADGDGEYDVPLSHAQAVWDWIYERAADDYDTYFQIKYYKGAFWVRFSAQIYLDIEDFEWGAKTLLGLCKRVRQGEWRSSTPKKGKVS